MLISAPFRILTFSMKKYQLLSYFCYTLHGSGSCAACGPPVARWLEMGTRGPVAMLHIGLCGPGGLRSMYLDPRLPAAVPPAGLSMANKKYPHWGY